MILNYCVLEKGLLASSIGMVAIIIGLVFQDLYKILQLDLVYNAELTKAFLKGKDLVKGFLKDWVRNSDTFKHKSCINYPISHF